MTDNSIQPKPKDLLKRFYSLQEERVQTYAYFEEGFQAYLNGAPNYNFPLYRQLVHEITQGFSKLSEEIIDVKKKFSQQCGLSTIAAIIDTIQDTEKQKLELTVQLQLARQKEKDHPEDETVNTEITDVKQRLKATLEKICEQLEELKYESEDLYDDIEEETDSTTTLDR